MLTLGRPIGAVGRSAKGVVAKAEERGLVVVSDDPYVAPTATVAAVGATLRDVRFAAKRDTAGPAIASLGV